MAAFPVLSYNRSSINGHLSVRVTGTRCLTECQSVSRSLPNSFSFPVVGCKSHSHRLLYNNKIRSVIGENRKKDAHLGNRESGFLRKGFTLRLRPRLRLLSSKLKRVSVRCMLDDLDGYLRKNMRKVTVGSLITVGLGICYLFLKLIAMPTPKVVPYSELIASLQNGSVMKVVFEEGSRRIYYNTNTFGVVDTPVSEDKLVVRTEDKEKWVEGSSIRSSNVVNHGTSSIRLRKWKRERTLLPQWQYSTRKIDHDESYLLSLMREKGTAYSSYPQSALMSMRNILITIMTLWIPLTPLMWLLYRQLSAANSPAKKRRPSNQLVNFDDVEGVDAAKVELMEIVMCLQGAINYNKLGAKLPRGVLLVGPPGTGKTLLARAVAGEAGVPFFTVSASEFVEMFVGRGAARIRDLFSVARKNAPSIIFIDELDAVGGKRGRSFNDERDQTLNQLLTEMDGFESDVNVIVIAATNRPEALDPALCRPGRFSRKVFVGKPDEEGRRKILAVHLRGIPLEEDIDLICNLVASLTQGFVGADLANIINEAALLAARRGGKSVAREDIMEAIERAKFGINERQIGPTALTKEIGKIFPWMSSFKTRNDSRKDDMQGYSFGGYQTLS